ncbi:hypothetical protein [uncultured Litoreibacter sp.]|uniref:hypothetical protein n=1 Tax=uncultured Litoreibacter sp. TaxID=1392394 RepID=UPI002619BD6D|nr:hypothetical protein [uncultured Litoreibacter sp.]
MKRRDFSLTVASAVCLASPMLATTKTEKPAFPSHGRVKMRLGGKVRQAMNFILLTPSGAATLPLNRQFPVANENRSSILTPTLAKKYRFGVDVGPVLTDGSNILANIDRPVELDDFHIADEKISYRVSAENIRPTRAPSLAKYPMVIGTAVIAKDTEAFANAILLKVRRDILILDALEGL